MSQSQGKKPRDTRVTSPSSEREEKTRTLSKLELAQMLQKASSEEGEDLTPRPFPVVDFGTVEASKNISALLRDADEIPSLQEAVSLPKEFVSSADNGGLPKPEKHGEEVTHPGIRIAVPEKQTQAVSPLSKSPKVFFLMGVLVGMLAGGGLFMLGQWLFSSAAG